MKEIWKDISGYEGFYQVSNFGNIKRVGHCDKNGHFYKERILNFKGDKRGYKHVHLSKNGHTKWIMVHRLVANEFLEKNDGCNIVNHLDSNPSNNHASNLEWTTYCGNMQHASKQGHMKYKPENLKKAQISHRKPVYVLFKDGTKKLYQSIIEACNDLGISHGHVAACCRKDRGYKTIHGYEFEYA